MSETCMDFCFFCELLCKELPEKTPRGKCEQKEWKKGNGDKRDINTVGKGPERRSHFFSEKQKGYDEEEKSKKEEVQKKQPQEFNSVVEEIFLWDKQGIDAVVMLEIKALVLFIFISE